MQSLFIVLGAAVLYLAAYHTYGRWLARRIFKLDRATVVPSVELNDNVDYVPTAKSVVFGHHFTSIAGTGPIVGPALAIMWGWVPALLWIVLGSIFMGAMHDLSTLVVSLRNRGMTVGEIAGRLLNPRVRVLFLVLLLFALWVVLAIFGWVIASVFVQFPMAILPVFLQIPIAVWIGLTVHRRGGRLLLPSVLALVLMFATVWLGAGCPGLAWSGGALGEAIQGLNARLAAWPIWVWVGVLLAYCYVASVMPVWVLLQPRDYINSLQLIASLVLLVAGLCVAALVGFPAGGGSQPLQLVAPAWNFHPLNAPPIFPFLFVTVACGAISGFHCLVSSGTSSKQLKCETDAQFVGYGSMLLEGFLAVLVIVSVGAGLGLGWPQAHPDLLGGELWREVYGDWSGVTGGKAIAAFVVGSGNLLQAIGLPASLSTAIMGVLVASFAGTTLDTATRLQRYVVQELAATVAGQVSPGAMAAEGYDTEFERGTVRRGFSWNPLYWLTTTHGATFFAVATAFVLAIFPAPGRAWAWDSVGTGGLILWPLFGATNQLLAGLALLVVSFWLLRRGLPTFFASIPMVIMLVMPAWALALDVGRWLATGSWILVAVSCLLFLVTVWMAIEGLMLWKKARGVLEAPIPDESIAKAVHLPQ
ncbi:MAG: carbon starvation protein A [Chthoniobacterales bacterium]|nr:carbon starvation protein A [Chthoniobacterales bacterium]